MRHYARYFSAIFFVLFFLCSCSRKDYFVYDGRQLIGDIDWRFTYQDWQDKFNCCDEVIFSYPDYSYEKKCLYSAGGISFPLIYVEFDDRGRTAKVIFGYDEELASERKRFKDVVVNESKNWKEFFYNYKIRREMWDAYYIQWSCYWFGYGDDFVVVTPSEYAETFVEAEKLGIDLRQF